MTSYDVVVVGGGAAGLSAGLALARSRRTVLVIDSGSPRNATSEHVHNYLGREGSSPADLLATGRAEVVSYGGVVQSGTVASVRRRDGGGFDVELDDGSTVAARRLLVATGLTDQLPDIPGLRERWGRDVLHCPYCHGWEVRDQALGILASGPLSIHQAQMFRQLSDDVTLFQHTAPQLGDEQLEQLAARGIRVVEGEVAAVEIDDDRIVGVRLRSGDFVPCQAVIVGAPVASRSDVLAPLGLQSESMVMAGHLVGTYLPAGPMGATAVAGVWVAGNVADPRATVIAAAAAGLEAGASINADLIAEETREAVLEQRRGRSAEAERYWDGRYDVEKPVWSGKPNAALVREVADLKPGTALDLGCAEGADAIWLAQQGWTVTGVDISRVALDHAAKMAAAAGVADNIDWQRHDLSVSFPDGTYDLVSALFLHSYLDLPRSEILRSAVAAVVPGGVLLVVGHLGRPSFAPDPHLGHSVHLPTAQEVLDTLALPEGEWELLRSDQHEHAFTGPDGQPATVTNTTLMLRRGVAADEAQAASGSVGTT